MEGKDMLYAGILLVIGCVIGYLVAPEYVHLEAIETENFNSQLQAKDDIYNAREEQWQEFAEECDDYENIIRDDEEEKCIREKDEMRDRIATKNEKLSEINKGWQEVIVDLNKTVTDFNRVLHDFNCDANHWR